MIVIMTTTPPVPEYPPYAGDPSWGQYGAPPVMRRDGIGTASLVLGILSLIIGGIVLGVPATFLGKNEMDRAGRGEATNGRMAKAGFILGIISTALSVLVVVIALIAD